MAVRYLWVSGHAGVEVNEDVGILAKLISETVNMNIQLCKADRKSILKRQIQKVWLKLWTSGTTMDYYIEEIPCWQIEKL